MIPRAGLVLGTAKFGMPWYGYGSTSRPTAHESIAILRHAWRQGIGLFDTALGYGDAAALLAHAGIPTFCQVMKARAPLSVPKPGRWEAALVHNPTLDELIHTPAAYGVSVYTVTQVLEAQRLGITPIQAPASCLNPPVSVDFARAPFLQGVLLRDPAAAPAGLQRAVRAFQKLADDSDFSRVALALHGAHRRDDGYLVFGVSSVAQLDAVLEAADQTVPADLIGAARDLATTVDATAALPSLWSRP